MKKNIYTIILLLFVNIISSQIQSNSVTLDNAIYGENPFFDLSTNFDPAITGSNNEGKGLVFPRTDLTSWTFITTLLDGVTFPTAFDGMVVFNTGTGLTGATPATQGQQVSVAPGFYYFSNPSGTNTVNNGSWLPIGGTKGDIKSKTVVVTVPANPTNATLNLGTNVITANEVNTYLGAKVYDNATNKLIMTADSDYDKATNVLTTGNGFMYQVLPAGTYKVVVDYR